MRHLAPPGYYPDIRSRDSSPNFLELPRFFKSYIDHSILYPKEITVLEHDGNRYSLYADRWHQVSWREYPA